MAIIPQVNVSPKYLLQRAKFAAMAYDMKEEDIQAFGAVMGVTFAGAVKVADGVAYVFNNLAEDVVVFTGTQLNNRRTIAEVFDDLDAGFLNLLDGAVHEGAFNSTKEMSSQIFNLCNTSVITVIGHSLGAARASLLPYFDLDNRIHEICQFAPFRTASAKFWFNLNSKVQYDNIIVINGNDPVPEWPFLNPSLLISSLKYLWLDNGKLLSYSGSRPGWNYTGWNDHKIEEYTAKLTTLAGE